MIKAARFDPIVTLRIAGSHFSNKNIHYLLAVGFISIMARIKDVAELAGVNRSTVSRIINGEGKFREETRKK